MTVFQRRNNGNDDFGLTLRTFCFYVMMLQSKNFILTLKRFTFQRQNIINLSRLKQRQNLTLKQRWFMVELKTHYVLCYTNRLNTWNNVENLSRGHINEFPRHFDVLCLCNFDRQIIDVILMYFSDIISMDGQKHKSIKIELN